MTLAAVLKKLKLSDAAFAAECGSHRTQIWAYRTGRYIPDLETAAKILAALKKHGVDMSVADLSKRRRSPSKAA